MIRDEKAASGKTKSKAPVEGEMRHNVMVAKTKVRGNPPPPERDGGTHIKELGVGHELRDSADRRNPGKRIGSREWDGGRKW